MTIAVYIDSCAWNYLYEHEIVLECELPPSRFAIYVTREVEIELCTIPDVGRDGLDKRALKAYIKRNIDRSPVKTSSVFGFYSRGPDGTPSPVQVYGGFGVGTFQSEEERDFYARSEVEHQTQNRKRTDTGLSKNQADASLAAKSFSAIVLTNERMNKSGPLKIASDLGGRVVFLSEEVKPSGLTLGEYLNRL